MKHCTKILLIDTNDAMGGVVRVHVSLLQTFDRKRVEPHVAYLPRGDVYSLFEAIPDTHLLKLQVGTKGASLCREWRAGIAELSGLFLLAGAVVRLVRYCRKHRIQVIHTSDKKRAVLLILLVNFLTGIPFIYHIHNIYVDYRANRWALSRAAAILANSEDMKRNFIETLGSAMNRIQVVYNGIDPAWFRPGIESSLRRELGLGPDDVLAGIVSRLAPDKGQETFLRAAAQIAALNRHAYFVIVGDDSIFSDNATYVPMLKKLVAELGLSGRVHFTGYRSDMPNVYAGLDIVVNAARREAFGMVLVEPMACEIPVIGTNAGGIPEIIEEGHNGFMFEPGDAGSLAVHLSTLISDAELRRSMGVEARRMVMEKYTIAKQARMIEDIYRETAAGGKI